MYISPANSNSIIKAEMYTFSISCRYPCHLRSEWVTYFKSIIHVHVRSIYLVYARISYSKFSSFKLVFLDASFLILTGPCCQINTHRYCSHLYRSRRADNQIQNGCWSSCANGARLKPKPKLKPKSALKNGCVPRTGVRRALKIPKCRPYRCPGNVQS